MDNNDPVVQEIPVYLGNHPELELNLFQFPLRPSYRKYNDVGSLHSISRGVDSGRYRIEYLRSLDPAYMKEDAATILKNLTQLKEENQKLDPDDQAEYDSMQKYTLQSEISKLFSNYTVCFLRNGTLFAYPLKSIHQFRPITLLANDEAINKSQSEKDASWSLKWSINQFSSTNFALMQRSLRERFNPIMRVYLDSSVEMFQLIKLLTTHPNSTQSSRISLYDTLENVSKINFSRQTHIYLKQICGDLPKLLQQSEQSSAISYAALYKLTLDQQLEKIMKEKFVMRFSAIQELITISNVPTTQLINTLQRSAILLHGLWFCKSNLSQSQESSWYKIEIRVRDIILCLINLKMTVDKSKLMRLSDLPVTKLNDILNQFFVFSGGSLRLKESPDEEFAKQYPQLSAKYQNEWTPQRSHELYDQIKNIQQEQRQFLESGNHSITLFKHVNAITCEEQLKNVLKTNGASSTGELLQPFIDALLKIEAKNVSPNTLQALSIDEQMRAQSIFTENAAVINALTISDLERLLHRVAHQLGSRWIVKDCSNPVLAPYRSLLIRFFAENPNKPLTVSGFQQEVREKLNLRSSIPDIQLRALLNEFAINKSGYWYFKGHVASESEAEDCAE